MEFGENSSRCEIRSFRGETQAGGISITNLTSRSRKWNQLEPTALRKDGGAGGLFCARAPLSRSRNNIIYVGRNGAICSPLGVRSRGISVRNTFIRLVKKIDQRIAISEMCRRNQQRFHERGSKAGNNRARLFREDAIGHVGKGWLRPLLPLTWPISNTLIRSGWDIAFRFGVNQIDKIRARDDVGFAKTIQACAVRTPTKLVSWGRIAEMCRSIRNKTRARGLPNADRASAYKHVPTNPDLAIFDVAGRVSPKMGNVTAPTELPDVLID